MIRIVYKNADNSVAVFIPGEQFIEVVGAKAVADKVVPQDLPYWFVDESDIPSDRSQRTAWEIDESMGDPDGFGGTSDEFTDEQLLALYQQGVIEVEDDQG